MIRPNMRGRLTAADLQLASPYNTYVNVGLPPMYRVHTIMQPTDYPVATPEGVLRLLKEMLSEKRMADPARRGSKPGSKFLWIASAAFSARCPTIMLWW